MMRRALRRQVLGQSLPLAAGRQHVEDGVQHLANVHLAPASATLGRRNHRLDQRPFGLAQITRIAQSATLGSAAVFRLPHRAPLNGHSGATQGITTDPSDSTTSWIGSYGLGNASEPHDWYIFDTTGKPWKCISALSKAQSEHSMAWASPGSIPMKSARQSSSRMEFP